MENNPKISHHIRRLATFGLPVIWFLLLMLLLNTTDPIKSGPLSVLAVLIVVYMLIASTLYALVVGMAKLFGALGFKRSFNLKLSYYLISVLSFGPVFLIALSTLGNLEFKDVVLVALLLGLGVFYVVRRGRAKPA